MGKIIGIDHWIESHFKFLIHFSWISNKKFDAVFNLASIYILHSIRPYILHSIICLHILHSVMCLHTPLIDDIHSEKEPHGVVISTIQYTYTHILNIFHNLSLFTNLSTFHSVYNMHTKYTLANFKVFEGPLPLKWSWTVCVVQNGRNR